MMFWIGLLLAGAIVVGLFWDEIVQGWNALMIEFEGDRE
jgi:hypothetical protein